MMTALSFFLVSVCPVSAMAGDVSACVRSVETEAPIVTSMYSEECEETRGVVRCEREDFIVSYVEVGADDPIAGLDDCGTM